MLQIAGSVIALVVLLLVPTVVMIWIGRQMAERLREFETMDTDEEGAER